MKHLEPGMMLNSHVGIGFYLKADGKFVCNHVFHETIFVVLERCRFAETWDEFRQISSIDTFVLVIKENKMGWVQADFYEGWMDLIQA